MSGTDEQRDRELAERLARIPVPDYEPGFWDRLEARLADEPAPSVRPADRSDGGGLLDDDRDAAVVPLAAQRRRTRAGRSRALAALAAAAAVLVAVLAVRLGGDDGADDLQVADGDRPTTTVALSSLPSAGTYRPDAILGDPGSTATPQDAFLTWITAVAEGDDVLARSLVGPMTAAYWTALDVDPGGAEAGWDRWAGASDLRLDVVDLGRVDGRAVVGLLVEGTADSSFEGAETPDGRDRDALVLVRDGDGWLVEPAAFDLDAESRLEPVRPAPGEQGLEPIAPGDDLRLAVQGPGTYFVGVDREPLTAFDQGDAVDGVLTYAPDPALEPGDHLLVIAHVSPEVLIIDALPFEVEADAGRGSG